MVPISVLIIARNEERNIGDCIRSCSFAQDILVVDDNSTDKTAEIAGSLGARVLKRSMGSDFGAQQTFAIENALFPWIFIVDADERCTQELAEEIEAAITSNEQVAYLVRRKNRFQHNRAEHGVLRPDYALRVMPVKGTFAKGQVHQEIVTPYPRRKMQGFMYHYTYADWQHYFNKFNNYTTLAADKYKSQGRKASFLVDIMLRPVWAFFKVYFLNLGFLDGKLGWILSVNHYFYTMNKYVKLYYLDKDDGKL